MNGIEEKLYRGIRAIENIIPHILLEVTFLWLGIINLVSVE